MEIITQALIYQDHKNCTTCMCSITPESAKVGSSYSYIWMGKQEVLYNFFSWRIFQEILNEVYKLTK